MKKYGKVFSLRLGAFKVVVAASGDSVKEMLVKRSADYAGRPPFHTFELIIIIIIIIVFIHTDKYTYPMLHFVKIDNYDNTKNN